VAGWAHSELQTGRAEAVGQDRDSPAVVVIMGVSGAGKTTVGRCLADRLRWQFQEGDRLHPRENVAKMASGQPLTDCDRAPWLDAVAKVIDGWRDRGECGVITCSALRRNYRKRIVGDRRDVRLVYLESSCQLIAQRLAARTHHFMPASLLESQFATLEPPGPDENPITVGIDRPVSEIVNRIVGALFPSAERPSSDCNAKGRK
jgi:carbohydrate kinase (thermoresistant glucokinase family)